MIKMNVIILYLFLILSINIVSAKTAPKASTTPENIMESYADCNISLVNDTLTLENNRICRKFKFNKGNLRSVILTDKAQKYSWLLENKKPDCSIPGLSDMPDSGYIKIDTIKQTATTPAYLQADIYTKTKELEIKRTFRLYPDCPAIECIYYFRGSTTANWYTATTDMGNLENIESNSNKESTGRIPLMETVSPGGPHWNVKCVRFYDITDRNNNLVNETNQIAYRQPTQLKGNLLFATDTQSGHGIFILKESPNPEAALDYPGFDFISGIGKFQVAGIGIHASDLSPHRWIRAYGFVTGVTYGGELGKITALRDYQSRIRIHKPDRDEMVIMNTWGDRNQDKNINASFITKELIKAAKLGISHYQIDDGWQTGRSANSAFKGGTLTGIWNNKAYWTPDIQKFPNGLQPIVDMGKKLGIEICLWFNPSKDSSYKNWRNDASALINLYKEQGIRTFKIDGVQINDKISDIRMRKMFDTVMKASQNRVVFNLDVTAGKRYGYHYFNEYGNIFLENRYTDWGNYYPFWTLRNLWQLSKYVPAQNLQIEFLNIFRNKDKYAPSDSASPSHVSFEYAFAITMMAQPLAWMEATGLPEKAFKVSSVIKKYRHFQSDIHAGKIFPIGNEPSGQSWTGFQSIKNDSEGYLLIIRERNALKSSKINTWIPAHRKVQLQLILGQGQDAVKETSENGALQVTLPEKNSYVLYRYKTFN